MLFNLQIFSGGVYPPSATSRTISFSISNSFGINFYFLRIDVGEQCGSQKSAKQHTALQSALSLFGCRRQPTPSLAFCSSFETPQKRFPHLAFGCSGFVFAVLGFCHRLTATLRLPDLQICLSRYGVVYNGKSHWKMQLMFSSLSFDYQN